MEIPFVKYQGTGNDFVIIDNRQASINLSADVVARWCDRKFGIGADGLMLLQEKAGYDFEMIYYNADGQLSSMCGNGGRCITAFAYSLGALEGKNAYFLAVDGPHEAVVTAADYVELKMSDVAEIEQSADFCFLDTGSPHYIRFVEAVNTIDVVDAGRTVRYSPAYQAEGVNVNFVEQLGANNIKVATYERGVEDETLSCGTGVTAAAIAYYMQQKSETAQATVAIETKGGDLRVRFRPTAAGIKDIWLCGPATKVFEGTISLG